MASQVSVVPIINFMMRLMSLMLSTSKISPAISLVVKPISTKSDRKKSNIVIRPKPPICINIKMILWPIVVKLVIGTVRSPVTVVALQVVKNRSKKLVGVAWQIGSAKSSVPAMIVNTSAARITRPG